jgi:N-acetyl-gamma-glutamyl-phosphate reductase
VAIRASILGASGYSGAELLRILSRHPHVKVDRLFAAKAAGTAVESLYPWFRDGRGNVFEEYTGETTLESDVVFIALPSGYAMHVVPALLERGAKVIDLGGDFRLQDTKSYLTYYKEEHAATDLLKNAVYGLPEWNKSAIADSKLIANPGCYPTSVILPLAPLLKAGLIKSEGIVINSLSGVSGAGRKADLGLSFSEVNESVKAYKVGNHQHVPEIASVLEDLSGSAVSFSFAPHLIPITRGIYTTISAMLEPGATEDDVLRAYHEHYVNAPFVNARKNHIPEIKHVLYTNNIEIGFSAYPGTGQLLIHSVIDNLVKGAAGQAVQNMNIMFGLNECEALN